MCNATMPIDVLKDLRFGIASLAQFLPQGSYERQLAMLAAKGIREDLDWVIANLERAGEGKKNFGLQKYAETGATR